MSHQPVHVRRPWAVAVLTIVTVGIYWPIWYFKVNRELRDVGRLGGDESLGASRPSRSVVAVILGGLILVPGIVSYLRFARRLRDGERAAGAAVNRSGVIATVLVAAQIISYASPGAKGSTFIVVGAITLALWLSAMVLAQMRMNAIARTLTEERAPAVVDAAVAPA